MSSKLGELEYNLIVANSTLELKAEENEDLQEKIKQKDEKIKALEKELNKTE